MADRPDSQEFGVEPRSSVKITLNAKGDRQVEVKVYAGETEADVERARELAITTFEETVASVAYREMP